MKPEPPSFTELKGKHLGQPAFILGGGPSLPEAHKKISKLKRPHIKISVNSHGCRLTKCDYAVYLDYKQINEQLDEIEADVIRISWGKECDYRMINHWHASNSTKVAVWCAWQMGCYPIVLLGVDCYGTDKPTYWHDADAISSGKSTPPSKHIEDWDRDTRTVIPHIRPVMRSIGGPLVRLFGEYDKDEKVEAPVMPDDDPKIREVDENGVLIQFIVGMKHKHEIYQRGEVARVDSHFANWAVIRNRAKYWEGKEPEAQSPFDEVANEVGD